MISAADFPDVFSCMTERGQQARSPTPGCIARWENEGGRTLPPSAAGRPPGDEPPVSRGSVQGFVPLLALTGPALAVTTLAIVSVTWTDLPR